MPQTNRKSLKARHVEVDDVIVRDSAPDGAMRGASLKLHRSTDLRVGGYNRIVSDAGYIRLFVTPVDADHGEVDLRVKADDELVVLRVEPTDEERRAAYAASVVATVASKRAALEEKLAKLAASLTGDDGAVDLDKLAHEARWSLLDDLTYAQTLLGYVGRFETAMASEKRVGDAVDVLRYVEALAMTEALGSVSQGRPSSRSTNGYANALDDARRCATLEVGSGAWLTGYSGGTQYQRAEEARAAAFGPRAS